MTTRLTATAGEEDDEDMDADDDDSVPVIVGRCSSLLHANQWFDNEDTTQRIKNMIHDASG